MSTLSILKNVRNLLSVDLDEMKSKRRKIDLVHIPTKMCSTKCQDTIMWKEMDTSLLKKLLVALLQVTMPLTDATALSNFYLNSWTSDLGILPSRGPAIESLFYRRYLLCSRHL